MDETETKTTDAEFTEFDNPYTKDPDQSNMNMFTEDPEYAAAHIEAAIASGAYAREAATVYPTRKEKVVKAGDTQGENT